MSASRIAAKAWVHNIYADLYQHTCPSRYLMLLVYRDLEGMRAAGTAYSRRRGSGEDLSEAAGMFQPSILRERWVRKRRVDTTGRFAGVMRLTAGYLNGEVIAHEATHAALHIWRMHMWTDGADGVDLGTECDQREEAFCHLLGAIAGEVANATWNVTPEER